MDAKLDRIAKGLATRRTAIGAAAMGLAGAALALPAAQPAEAKKKCNACCTKKKQTSAQLQFLHAAPDAPAVDVYVNGVVVATALAYGEQTELATYDSGEIRILVIPAGGAPEFPVLDLFETLDACRSYLFAISGRLPGLTGRALIGLRGFLFDQYRSKIKDAAAARATAIHLVPEGPVVGVRLETAAAGNRGYGGYSLATNIQFGDQSAPVDVPAGSYDVVVFDADTQAVLLRQPALMAGKALTQIAVIQLPDGGLGITTALVVNASCCGKY